MSLEEKMGNMNDIEMSILEFIENEGNIEEQFQNLIEIFNDTKIHEKKSDLISVLKLLVKISNHHHRLASFFEKIDKILIFFKDNMKTNFSSREIFNIFKGNKRILLFLIDEKIVIIDEYIINQIIEDKYLDRNYFWYFLPEIKVFINEKLPPENIPNDINKILNNFIEILSHKLSRNFYEDRKIGENESIICKLIRNDSVEDFIQYVNKNSYFLNSKIQLSIYETSHFLMRKKKAPINNQQKKTNNNTNDLQNKFGKCTKIQSNLMKQILKITKGYQINNIEASLIEYAAFFGSLQIFQYLRLNNVELSSSLWYYAIHGNNPELIHLLEEDHIKPEYETYMQCFIESLKCHHNEIADYFKNNYIQNPKTLSNFLDKYLKYHNFYFLNSELIDQSSLYYLCQYDYQSFVEILCKTPNIEINNRAICRYIFLIEFVVDLLNTIQKQIIIWNCILILIKQHCL